MRKLAVLMMIFGMLAGQSAWGVVTSTTFSPTPSDLQDLEHGYYYSWNVSTGITDPTTVVGARLYIDNINDWQIESNDHLYIHMVDEAPTLRTRISSDVTRGTDNEGGGDAFSGQGRLLVNYSDTNDYTEWIRSGCWYYPRTVNPAEDLVYDFSLTEIDILRTFLANGSFGLLFDPDCHYYNDGISLTIYTQEHEAPPPTVPEPATGLLALLGMSGMAGVQRLRKRFAR